LKDEYKKESPTRAAACDDREMSDANTDDIRGARLRARAALAGRNMIPKMKTLKTFGL